MGISNSMYTAVTGLDTFGTALSVVSDNIANANSTGYKASSALFGDLVSGFMATQATQQVSQGTGTSLLGTATDFTTGSSTHTGTWSNVMIQGNGFFNVNTANDGSGTNYYTRDGSFTVDSSGYLTNMDGYYVLNTSGGAIAAQTWTSGVPNYVSWNVDKLGNVWGTPSSGAAKVNLGTIKLTTFPNQQGLVRDGNNLYTANANAGTASSNTGGTTATSNPEAGQVIAGALEGSNVDLAKEMVDMIIYQSDYTANSKAITTSNNMLDTVVNLIR